MTAAGDRITGLDWDPLEYLLRCDELIELARAYDPHELRVTHGPGGGRWTHVGTLVGLEAPHVGGQPPKMAAPPTATAQDLADAVVRLQTQFEAKTRELDETHRQQMAQVMDQMRTEQRELVDLADREHEVALAHEQHRSKVIEAVVEILGLCAVAALILATGGGAIPALAATAPLVGTQALHMIHSQHEKRRLVSPRGRAGETVREIAAASAPAVATGAPRIRPATAGH